MTEHCEFLAHALVRFYIPLRRAMPIPYGPYYLYEHKDASWLVDYIPHPESDIDADVADPGRRFVQIRWMHREGYAPIVDFSLSQDAIDLAMHELTPEEQKTNSDHSDVEPQLFQWSPVTTVMVATTPILIRATTSLEHGLNDAFDRVLVAARRWETGYRIESGDLLFSLSSRPSMAPMIPWTYLNLEDSAAKWSEWRFFLVNEGAAHAGPPADYLGPEKVNRIGTRYQRALLGDPFVSFSSLSALAFRLHSIEGDFSSAAIQSFS